MNLHGQKRKADSSPSVLTNLRSICIPDFHRAEISRPNRPLDLGKIAGHYYDEIVRRQLAPRDALHIGGRPPPHGPALGPAENPRQGPHTQGWQAARPPPIRPT